MIRNIASYVVKGVQSTIDLAVQKVNDNYSARLIYSTATDDLPDRPKRIDALDRMGFWEEYTVSSGSFYSNGEIGVIISNDIARRKQVTVEINPSPSIEHILAALPDAIEIYEAITPAKVPSSFQEGLG